MWEGLAEFLIQFLLEFLFFTQAGRWVMAIFGILLAVVLISEFVHKSLS
jgi:hypothetical protein